MSACANLSGGIRQVEPRYVRLRSSGRSVLFDGGFERPEKHPVGHGLVRKRKMFPTLTAEVAASRSALPVNKTRTVFGAACRTSSSIPK